MPAALTQKEKERDYFLLTSGYTYEEMEEITGVKAATMSQRNYLYYGIDVTSCVQERLTREGFPNRLNVSDAFGYWFSGFFDGEGSISIRPHYRESSLSFNFSLSVVQRADDRQVLDCIQVALGGHVTVAEKQVRNNMAEWKISSLRDLAEVIVPLFDKYTLRTKKKQEYIIWREFVLERYVITRKGTAKACKTSEDFRQRFLAAADKVTNLRHYDEFRQVG